MFNVLVHYTVNSNAMDNLIVLSNTFSAVNGKNHPYKESRFGMESKPENKGNSQ